MKSIHTENAPKVIGPYSQAVEAGDFVYVSGQLPIAPQEGMIVTFDIKKQTIQVLENLKAILESADLSFSNVVKADVYVADLSDFALINEIYGQYFKGPVLPARKTVQVAKLPLNALIEISCIAYKGK